MTRFRARPLAVFLVACAAREAYPAVQAACDDCHVVFRPELVIPGPR